MKSILTKIIKRDLTPQAKYFLIAIILVGSIGVWLPILLGIGLNKDFQLQEIPINLTTFYVSIYFGGCIDSILKLIDSKHENGKSTALNHIALILLSIALITATIWLNIVGSSLIALGLALFGTFIALKLWWKNNVDNPLFIDVRDKRSEEQEEIMDSLS